MGNCQEQFENIKDDFSEISQRDRILNTIINHQHHSIVDPYSPPKPNIELHTSRLIDQELLHSTFVKRNEVGESQIRLKTELSLVEENNLDTISHARLKQLDFILYNKLALSDYQFQDIPLEFKRQYTGLQTVEQKDSHGVKYIGQWKNGLLHGNGILISNTFKYIGQFKNGLKQFHGREIFTHEVYEGEFDAGRRKGRGVRYTDGQTQIGIFDGNFIYGFIKYTNQDSYKGSLKNNKYDGIGFDLRQFPKFQSPSQKHQFERIFHDEYLRKSIQKWIRQHPDDGLGNSTYQSQTDTWYQNCHYDDGNLLSARVKYSNGNIYEGQLNKLSKHGKGKYLWKDGSMYEGQYFKDEKHGRGTLIANGKQYRDRQFINGVMSDQRQSSIIEDQPSEMPQSWR